eukprot:1548887-Rhodomonas_salina.1
MGAGVRFVSSGHSSGLFATSVQHGRGMHDVSAGQSIACAQADSGKCVPYGGGSKSLVAPYASSVPDTVLISYREGDGAVFRRHISDEHTLCQYRTCEEHTLCQYRATHKALPHTPCEYCTSHRAVVPAPPIAFIAARSTTYKGVLTRLDRAGVHRDGGEAFRQGRGGVEVGDWEQHRYVKQASCESIPSILWHALAVAHSASTHSASAQQRAADCDSSASILLLPHTAHRNRSTPVPHSANTSLATPLCIGAYATPVPDSA